MKFSVLISVYYKADALHFYEALKSTLVNQSVVPNEVVIVKDGPLTTELDEVIKIFHRRFPDVMKIVALPKNVGLGKALGVGLEQCTFELVARMDADDINVKNRFENQLTAFSANPDVHVLGSQIAEFYDHPNEIKSIRNVPLHSPEIIKMCKHRNPMNHVSVMFKKSAVLDSGSYVHLSYLEDYYLWIRMLDKGYKFMNIDEPLVFVRTGKEMFKRRGNRDQIKGWLFLQKKMKKIGLIGYSDFSVNMIAIVGFVYTPPLLKEHVYRLFLRRTEKEDKSMRLKT